MLLETQLRLLSVILYALSVVTLGAVVNIMAFRGHKRALICANIIALVLLFTWLSIVITPWLW